MSGGVRAPAPTWEDEPSEDHVVQIDGATWEDYERLVEVRGERSVPRITYVEGVLELMTPSGGHEKTKSLIGRLVETYCLHAGIRFTPYGSWTLRESKAKVGAEPDECYMFGTEEVDRPHLAIEVFWTRGRLDKLDIYRKLGVRELWYWRKGQLQLHALRGDRYEPIKHSEVLPDLDLDLLMEFLDRPTAYDAICDYRAALTGRPSD